MQPYLIALLAAKGVPMQAGVGVTVVAVNLTDTDAQIEFAFPRSGDWTERLDGRAALSVTVTEPVSLVIASNYGQVWTLG